MPLNVYNEYTLDMIYARTEAFKQKLINTALARKIANKPEDLVVRDILPMEDLGSSTESLPPNPIAKRVEDNKIIGFFGVAEQFNSNNGIYSIKFKKGPQGNKIVNWYQVESVYITSIESKGLFDEDIIYKNGEYMEVDFIGGTDSLLLLGFVVEPKGVTVDPGGYTLFSLPYNKIQALKEATKNYLKDLAVKKGIVTSKDKVVVRDIQPDVDLNFESNQWLEDLTSIPSAGWYPIVSLRVPDNKLFAFYGLTNTQLNIQLPAISFTVGPTGAKTKVISWTSPLFANSYYKEAFFSSPIIYENGQYMTIKAYSDGAGQYFLILLGYVAEPKGETIDPE